MPRAWLEGTHDFSFSGLKTAVLHLVRQSAQNDPNPKLQPSSMRGEIAAAPERIADIAAAFQESVVDVLTEKTRRAAEQCGARCVIVGGGVAANRALRERMQARIPVPVLVPPPALCTDNGAVIAAAGHFQRVRGERSGWDLDVVPGLRLTQA
jgi:N6-L-threonylcarbamoyladenine synthase